MSTGSKDYSTISQSAAFLIQLKAYTTIPFAKETAALLERENPAMAEYIRKEGVKQFFKWLLHFENRYRTIEKTLSAIDAKNILEISSGYSFRGLSLCLDKNVYFIDTDLPDLIAGKQRIVEKFIADAGRPLKGHLELHPLNALDENAFNSIVNGFPEGPITVLNEGLLMYLGEPEKIKICSIVHNILKQRGGRWITADVYIRRKPEEVDVLDSNEQVRRFREEHHIEENKFQSFVAAEKFFTDCGFTITRREAWVIEELSCLHFLDDEKRTALIQKLRNSTPENETWTLEVKR